MRRRSVAAIVIVLLAVALGVVVYRAAHAPASSTPPTARPKAPAFRVAALTGGTVSLASLHGKTVVVGFVQPDCGTCVGTLRTLAQVAAKAPAGRVAVLAVNVNTYTTAADLARFASQIGAEHGPQFVLDRGDRMARAYGVQTLETEVVIDPAGRIVTKGVALPASKLLAAARPAAT